MIPLEEDENENDMKNETQERKRCVVFDEEKRLWSAVVLSAVDDLLTGLGLYFRIKNHLKVKGFSNRKKRQNMIGRKRRALAQARWAFGFLFDKTFDTTSGWTAEDIMLLIADPEYIREGVIKKARRELQPEALAFFETALQEVRA